MEEDVLDVDHHRQGGSVATDGQLVEERSVADQLSSPVDAESVATARDHEDQTDVRVAQDVAVAVGRVAGTAVRGS